MRVGVLGSGVVGATIATKLVELGHEVTMGSRVAGNERAVAWANSAGERAHQGSFADAARFGELLINATAGAASVDALRAAGAENVDAKVLLDVSNPIVPDSGFPPELAPCNTDSVAESIQRAFPAARVVKTLNTVTAAVMVNPGMISSPHTIFVAGNDAAAKLDTKRLLQSFGWADGDILDLGDISNARGTEMYLALWIRMYRALGDPRFNIHVVRAA